MNNTPEYNFFRRLVAMYGEWQATVFYKEIVGAEPPEIKKEEEASMFNLNNM